MRNPDARWYHVVGHFWKLVDAGNFEHFAPQPGIELTLGKVIEAYGASIGPGHVG